MSKHRRGKIKRHASQHLRHAKERAQKPDLEIEVDTADPVQAKALDEVLQEAKKVGVEVFTKTYEPDPKSYIGSDGNTHSIGIRPHPHNLSIAKDLLNIAGYKSHAGPLAPPLEHDDRPLIDLLHEATFTNPPGLHAISDLYALRMLLRKAHCFTLDDATSAMVADFSLATIADLEATRQMAIPPFNVTWIELNNHARLNRMKLLGAPLEKDDPNNPSCKRIGWLIYPSHAANGWYATYATVADDIGVWVAPMSYWWHAASANPDKPATLTETGKLMEWLAFGTAGNVGPYDAFVIPSHLHLHYAKTPGRELVDAMTDMAGELRHIWSFLVALGAGHLGASAQYTAQAVPTRAPPIMKNGKPLLPLEHKVLHLHLNKKTPAKIVAQAITHHHNRRHDVRAHWRQLKSGKRIPVRSHQRGDEALGRIEKTYRVEK